MMITGTKITPPTAIDESCNNNNNNNKYYDLIMVHGHHKNRTLK